MEYQARCGMTASIAPLSPLDTVADPEPIHKISDFKIWKINYNC
jgi:hypothetical protein